MEPTRKERSGRRLPSEGGDLDQRTFDALTDLVAYALKLDSEHCRLDTRVGELTQEECSAADLCAVLRERAELAEECQEFRGAIADFREQFVRE